jgi:hypothetical protein
MSVHTIWTGISFAIRHWSLIMSFLSFPKIPDDWSDKEKVRLFVIALATSAVADELSQLVQTMWTAKFRASVAALANNKFLWDTAWVLIANADRDDEKIVGPKTLRERIRSRFSATQTVPASELGLNVSDVEDLVSAIQMVKLAFCKKRS